MTDKLEQLVINYAKAHRDLRLARRAFQAACDDMHWPALNEPAPKRKFHQVYGDWKYSEGHASYFPGDRVEDCDNLFIIARWQEAHYAKVAASRKLGAIKGAILKHGKILLLEDE